MSDKEVLLAPFFRRLSQIPTWSSSGRVTKSIGTLVESDGPICSVGDCCEIVSADGQVHQGEVVGFRGRSVLSMPLDRSGGIRFGDRVVTHGVRPSLPVSDALIG